MPAPQGNTNAEKWTEEQAVELIEKVHQYNIANKGNYHLGYALIELGYYPQIWSYILNKFPNSTIVFEAIKKTEAFIEGRIINSTMSGQAKSAAMAIFLLKNKYGYEDTQQFEVKDYKTWADRFRNTSSQESKTE